MPTLSPARFAEMVQTLLGLLARYGHQRKIHGPLLVLISNHIRAIERRVIGLLERIAAGTPRRHPGRRRPAPRAAPRPPPARPLPTGHAWLIRLVQETAQAYPRLQFVLSDPGLPALLEQVPQLRRALRPLCTMLAVSLPKPPPKPAAAPDSPPARRPPAARPAIQAPAVAPPARAFPHTPPLARTA
jgi:hypothetical protein